MDLLIRRRPEWDRQYNCSMYDMESLPASRRTHEYLACLIISIGFVAELLYIPCTYALYKQAIERKNFCYRLMLISAISDVVCLPASSFVSGHFWFTGKMFCSAPVLIYVSGIFCFGMWSLYASTSLILAINRCLAFSRYSWIFDEWRQCFWILTPIVYSVFMFLYARPPIWNSVYGAWFLNPHLGYIEDTAVVFTSPAQTWFNTSISILLPTIYFIFFLSHSVLSRGRNRMPKKEYSLFLQILIMNLVLSSASFTYVIMNYVKLPEQLVCIANLGWVSIQSSPPIIYLTMNTTVQRTLFPRRFQVGTVTSTQPTKLRAESDCEPRDTSATNQ